MSRPSSLSSMPTLLAVAFLGFSSGACGTPGSGDDEFVEGPPGGLVSLLVLEVPGQGRLAGASGEFYSSVEPIAAPIGLGAGIPPEACQEEVERQLSISYRDVGDSLVLSTQSGSMTIQLGRVVSGDQVVYEDDGSIDGDNVPLSTLWRLEASGADGSGGFSWSNALETVQPPDITSHDMSQTVDVPASGSLTLEWVSRQRELVLLFTGAAGNWLCNPVDDGSFEVPAEVTAELSDSGRLFVYRLATRAHLLEGRRVVVQGVSATQAAYARE